MAAKHDTSIGSSSVEAPRHLGDQDDAGQRGRATAVKNAAIPTTARLSGPGVQTRGAQVSTAGPEEPAALEPPGRAWVQTVRPASVPRMTRPRVRTGARTRAISMTSGSVPLESAGCVIASPPPTRLGCEPCSVGPLAAPIMAAGAVRPASWCESLRRSRGCRVMRAVVGDTRAIPTTTPSTR